MHTLVQLAREAIEEYIRNGRLIAPPKDLTGEMCGRAGVFVCLKTGGCLRGCIGTFEPTEETVAEEVIRNAVAAATQDPRFHPVQEHELHDMEYSVDVLSRPEKIMDISELNPREYGIIVVQEKKRGLLLPDLEGVDTVDEQLRITKMKAGIWSDDNLDIFRFKVIRYR